jgi:Glycogen recognition site of AMP-activated protein kinase
MRKSASGKKSKIWRVTFEMPAELDATQVAVCGEWNNWRPEPLVRRRDGRFSLTRSLAAGHQYRFRYLLDDTVGRTTGRPTHTYRTRTAPTIPSSSVDVAP